MADLQYTVVFIKDVVTIAFYSVGAYVALSGLQAWRREHLGKAHYELAKAILTLVYKIRSAVYDKRSRFSMESFLIGSVDRNLDELSSQERRFEIARRNHELLDARIRALFTELKPLLLEADVLFGPSVKIREAIQATEDSYLSLVSAVHDYLGPGAARFADSSDSTTELRRVVYRKGNPPGGDKFDNKFQATIRSTEALLVPYLRGGT